MPPPIPNTAAPVGRRRLVLFLLLGLLAAIGLLGILGFSIAFFIVGAGQSEIVQRQRLILYRINPNTLLAACATIRAKQAAFTGNPDWHPTPRKGSDNPDPADPQMPPVIGKLVPCTISILPEGVRIELGGGFYHYGLAEQLPGAPKPAFAARQLVPGLWYYAEDGKAPSP